MSSGSCRGSDGVGRTTTTAVKLLRPLAVYTVISYDAPRTPLSTVSVKSACELDTATVVPLELYDVAAAAVVGANSMWTSSAVALGTLPPSHSVTVTFGCGVRYVPSLADLNVRTEPDHVKLYVACAQDVGGGWGMCRQG